MEPRRSPPLHVAVRHAGARSPDNAGPPPTDMPMLQLHLNGQPHRTDAPCTVADLLAREHLAERRVAVEVNGAIVPRSAHATHALMDGDRIEIVHALGGG